MNLDTGNPAPVGMEILVEGRVQGVGMRPAVYRLARRLGLSGRVWNDGGRVVIQVWGAPVQVGAFRRRLPAEPPPRARIEAIRTKALAGVPPVDFRILPGRPAAAANVPPDVAVCDACMVEVRDPTNRRHRYPFTHCADCGPRFSVIERLPYERRNTSLRRFPLCRDCEREYHDPDDRRFHAEAIACPVCGPRLWTRPACAGDPIAQTVAWLRQGKIVAVRGVGGFQLLADATDAAAVARLRARKRRPHKPFALMARDMAVVRRYARVPPEAAAALTAPEAPVVLLDALGETALPEAVAPGLGRLGFILPYTALHHLLLESFDTPLVFTSANRSGAPLCADNDEALEALSGIADAFLLHDRDIVHRCDDSVVLPATGPVRVVRAARGLAPLSLSVPPGFEGRDGILALGGGLKATFCLLHRGRAILSQHLGDLEDARSFAGFQKALADYRTLFGFQPRQVAVDRHPEYLSGKWGRRWARSEGLALTEVQHHHAHLAACLAEYRHPQDGGAVMGLILDGLGWGSDGTFWGGELLYGDYLSCRRLAWLRPTPLPGGVKAMTEPWRNLVAQLWQAGLDPGSLPVLRGLPVQALLALLEKGLNCPPASSTGRLFDAVAAALGLCPGGQSYEGQAAALLEHLAWQSDDEGAYPFTVDGNVLDPAPLWSALLADLARGVEKAAVARRFHRGLALAWVSLIGRLRPAGSDTLVLGGGVFQNRLLLETVRDRLEASGWRVWIPRQAPLNDGGLSLGQALIAAAGG
ncbi:carbamoyltransferase HypF [Methylomarinovum tepidoasis]|uniref:carbamoyltransferase HypF n=1 Tax=Methylomarinovum tepidoasis TaxID=2840183 RepID=UPI002573C1AB|nr:carbamoyltransferase HypF [Methylomarinovum sp. IN45]